MLAYLKKRLMVRRGLKELGKRHGIAAEELGLPCADLIGRDQDGGIHYIELVEERVRADGLAKMPEGGTEKRRERSRIAALHAELYGDTPHMDTLYVLRTGKGWSMALFRDMPTD